MLESGESLYSRLATAALAAAASGLALAWFVWTWLMWSRWHPHLPWRDLFVIIDDLKPLFDSSWQLADLHFLFDAHYAAHRIAVPRLLVYADLMFFAGRGHVLYAAGWMSIATILLLLAWRSRHVFAGQRALWFFFIALSALIFFSPAHWWNLTNAINTSWHLSFAFALGALLLLTRSREVPGIGTCLLAYTLATLSAFTTFAGVIAWLILPVLVRGTSRSLLLGCVVASAVCTFLYLQGVSSDAGIAARWEGGGAAATAELRAAGEAALAGNSLRRIVTGAGSVLCWPLSEKRPVLAGVLFLVSLGGLAAAWLGQLRVGRRTVSASWFLLCAGFASLALGTALAIQLGRLIEQANYAHGPSYERYNTIVAVYWTAISGLVAGWLRSAGGTVCVLSMALLLVAVLALQYPSGRYLEQEIGSFETAARLYAGGEKPFLRPKRDGRARRFKPEYVYSFDSLFTANQLAYARPEALPAGVGDNKPCSPEAFIFRTGEGPRSGLSSVRLRLPEPLSWLARDVVLSRGGRLLVRLHAEHVGEFSALSLLASEGSEWRGIIKDRDLVAKNTLVSVNLAGGGAWRCHWVQPLSPVERGRFR